MKLNQAITLFQEYKLEEAQLAFEQLLEEEPGQIDALVYLGRIHSRTQNYGEAMNCYQQVLDKYPENSSAKTGLQLIKNILQLTNNYYFENAYTDDELYDFES